MGGLGEASEGLDPAVAVAVEGEDLGVVDEAVDDGNGLMVLGKI